MLVHALMPEIPAVPRSPATYGELLDATQRRLHAAIDLAQGPPIDPDALRAEFHGFRRFLIVCGSHLGLLAHLQHGVTREQRQLIQQLTSLKETGAEPSTWGGAARQLGAAHDLVATHVDAGCVPRTAEAEELITPKAALAPFREVTGMVVQSLQSVPDLLDLSRRSRPRDASAALTKAERDRVGHRAPSLMPLAKAALLDAAGGSPTSPLYDLQVAAVLPPGRGSASGFDSALQALRLLGQLTYRQGHGELDASATSVRDLALLGAELTNPDLPWLPPATTAMERLDRAQAQDIFNDANHAWTTAAQDLTRSVVGTTRAPRLYADALEQVKRTEPDSATVRIAMLSALPRLGTDAAGVVQNLHRRNALVEKRREPGGLRLVWRPISADEANRLSSNIRAAASSSANAVAVARRLTSPRPATNLPTAPPSHLTCRLAAERTRLETR